jgi:hypothetical protein
MATTFTKLRDGSWGLRIEGSAQNGQSVTVTKKSGEQEVKQVGKVLWTGNGISLATIASNGNGHSHSSSRGRGRSYGDGGCSCDDDCCSRRCQCDRTCNCRGGNIYDC